MGNAFLVQLIRRGKDRDATVSNPDSFLFTLQP